MVKKLAKIFVLALFMYISVCQGAAFQAQDKIYIDPDSFKANTKGDEFYIHVGNNVWLITHSIHRDATGMFSYENNLSKFGKDSKMEYEKKWRCPYCYQYWPIGKACGNPDCPSKYK